jgi:hypothetical protein
MYFYILSLDYGVQTPQKFFISKNYLFQYLTTIVKIRQQLFETFFSIVTVRCCITNLSMYSLYTTNPIRQAPKQKIF